METGIHLDRIINGLITERSVVDVLSFEEMAWLCRGASQIFLSEPSLLEIPAPVNICGDLHGQYNDLIRVLQAGGFDESKKYLFLGDYVDRGDKSLEVVCLLFAMKMRFPQNIFMLRGNHESPEMTEAFGFMDECQAKVGDQMIPFFLDAFDCLPIAALVGGRIFCVHGGLSPTMQDVHMVNTITRPTAIPDEGILADLLWSDPSAETQEWGPNDRGATWTWGLSVADAFMKYNNLDCIVRAHQLAENGYDFPFAPDQRVITVFTASSYANRYRNQAAFINVDETHTLRFGVLDPIDDEYSEAIECYDDVMDLEAGLEVDAQ